LTSRSRTEKNMGGGRGRVKDLEMKSHDDKGGVVDELPRERIRGKGTTL